jgi:brefeldin A-inhibited guanine nucleotide-exchange protein
MDIVASPTSIIHSSSSHEASSFIQMADQYLCLCLSRNAVSPVPQVFEISVEIFWRTLSGLRTKLKKEIEVLFHEIFIPILEMKTSTLKQKSVIVSMLSKLCQDPQALVDIYINYDCDSEAADNIYEQSVTTLWHSVEGIILTPLTAWLTSSRNSAAAHNLAFQAKRTRMQQVPPLHRQPSHII